MEMTEAKKENGDPGRLSDSSAHPPSAPWCSLRECQTEVSLSGTPSSTVPSDGHALGKGTRAQVTLLATFLTFRLTVHIAVWPFSILLPYPENSVTLTGRVHCHSKANEITFTCR